MLYTVRLTEQCTVNQNVKCVVEYIQQHSLHNIVKYSVHQQCTRERKGSAHYGSGQLSQQLWRLFRLEYSVFSKVCTVQYAVCILVPNKLVVIFDRLSW